MCLLAALTLPTTAGAPVGQPQPETYWHVRGCTHGHPSRVAYRRVKVLMRHHRPAVDRKRVGHWAVCVASREKSQAVWSYVRWSWRWRHSYAHVWPIRFHRLSPTWQRWARVTGACESGNDPRAVSPNGDYGSHQFKRATARAAGFTRNPVETSWWEQAVRAVWWRWRSSQSQWPRCAPF